MKREVNFVARTPTDDLDMLLVDSAIAAIEPDAPLAQIEAALRSLSTAAVQIDSIRHAFLRETVIRKLRAAGLHSPVAVVDMVLKEPQQKSPTGIVETVRSLEPWPETVPGSALLQGIAEILGRFIALPSTAIDAEALWALHTYVHDIARTSPILCLSSPEKRCGKTRNLEILACLVYRPVSTANISEAALYRLIHRDSPTLLIDEVDTIFAAGSKAELRGMLHAGLYRSHAYIYRCEGRNGPQAFSVWCPKVMALIGRLPSTLEDRSIAIPMRRKMLDEAVTPFRFETLLTELEPIRSQALRWAIDHRDHLIHAEPRVPIELHDRARDLWRPLLAIAERAGGSWPERAWRAALDLSGHDVPDASLPVQLLEDLRQIFRTRQAEQLSSETIVTELATFEHRRWPDWSHGRPMTPAQLARLLAPFGIRPQIVVHTRTRVRRGYVLADFGDAFARYLPSLSAKQLSMRTCRMPR